jgi:hypothetical protein
MEKSVVINFYNIGWSVQGREMLFGWVILQRCSDLPELREMFEGETMSVGPELPTLLLRTDLSKCL